MSWLAEDLMTRRVVCVYADTDLRDLTNLFLETGISGAPVTSRDGDLLGVVSQRDLLRHSASRDAELMVSSDFYGTARLEGAQLPKGFQIVDTTSGIVADIMTPVLYTVPESAPVEKVAALMRRRHIHRVIVLRDGKVAGLISALDLIAVLSTAVRQTKPPGRVKKK